MRIIAGVAKGRRLQAPRGPDVRPTTDRVKEALFSSLQPVLSGARVLDLYAGSGSLGLEALSRGAASAVFVERDPVALRGLRANIEAVGVDGALVLASTVTGVLAGPPGAAGYDLVFADPPYGLGDADLDTVVDRLAPHLADGAVVVVERGSRSPAPSWPAGFEDVGSRRYGEVTLHRARWSA